MNEQQWRAHHTIVRIAAALVRGTYQDAVERGTVDQRTVSVQRLGRLIAQDADAMRTAGADLADALKVLTGERRG